MPHCSSTPRRRPLTMPLTSFEERALPLGAWVILDRFVGHKLTTPCLGSVAYKVGYEQCDETHSSQGGTWDAS